MRFLNQSPERSASANVIKQALQEAREWKVAFHDTTLSVVSPAPREVWRELLESDPNALITQTPDWLDCICDLGDYEDASRLYHGGDGRKLVLPLVRRRGLPRKLTVSASLPQIGRASCRERVFITV